MNIHEWQTMESAPTDGTIIFGRIYFSGVPGTFRVQRGQYAWLLAGTKEVCRPKEWRPISAAKHGQPKEGE